MSAAADSGIPAVAIRAISDSVDEDMPIDMTDIFTDEGANQHASHPCAGREESTVHRGTDAARQQQQVAAEAIAGFLDRYVSMVAARMSVWSKMPLRTRQRIAGLSNYH